MPDLDVSDILGDPDIAGELITVVRNTRATNVKGRGVDTPTTFTTYGNVQPASGRQIQTLPEAMRQSASISVTVPVRLIGLKAGTAPDIITWDSNQYRVMSVQPYGNYGAGYWAAVCTMLDLVESDASVL
jgi:hypothetical protein